MKIFLSLFLLANTISAFPTESLKSQCSSHDKFVSLDFSRKIDPIYSSQGLKGRSDQFVSESLTGDYVSYLIELNVGTPPQTFIAAIDTGSSDLWVVSSNNAYCAQNPQIIPPGYINCTSRTFNYNESSTFQSNNSAFGISYADYSVARGVWATDNLEIGGVTLLNSSIAVASQANSSEAVFGIGFPAIEATLQGARPYTYENVPQLLKTQGHINTVAYSLWLNSLQSQSGQILFGAVDHDKYEDTLFTVPLVKSNPNASNPTDMTVLLSGLSFVSSNGDQSLMSESVGALLDSGTTNTYLPQKIVDSIGKTLGGERVKGVGTYILPCSVKSGNTSLLFNFSGANITVPLSEVITELKDDDGRVMTYGGISICSLGISPTSSRTGVILGDSFLRSAYVVYDLENFEVSLANTKFNATSSNIEVINGTVPRAVRAPDYETTKEPTSQNEGTTAAGHREVPSKMLSTFLALFVAAALSLL